MVKLNGNFFNIDIDGLPIQATNLYPNYMATYWPNNSFIPWINYNKRRVTGFDLGLQFRRISGPVEFSLGANVMYATTKNLRIKVRPWNTIGLKQGGREC